MGVDSKVEEDEVLQERLEGVAEIPEYQGEISTDVEYKNFPEERIWSPDEEVNAWVPAYVFMARSALTYAQEEIGVPNTEAIENSCTGCAEQYITDTLHDSEYSPEVALKTLVSKRPPEKLFARWTDADIELFLQGIVRHGKNFSRIQKNFLFEKSTKEIIEFYYTWKWTEAAKVIRKQCGRRRPNKKSRFPSIGSFFRTAFKVTTRSSIVAKKNSSDTEKKENQPFHVDNNRRISDSKGKRKRRSDPTPIR